MKNRILTFIIGILVGAILTTSCFLVYSRSINKNFNQRVPFENNEQMKMPNGNIGEPPEKPEGDFRQQMSEENM